MSPAASNRQAPDAAFDAVIEEIARHHPPDHRWSCELRVASGCVD
jgi:hypothetical protein